MKELSSTINNYENKGLIRALVKGTIISVVVSLVGILLFALVLKFIDISDNVIRIVNQVIKVLSILLGVRSTLKVCPTKGLFKGIIVGILYTIFAYVIFSFLSTSISFDLTTLIDLLFGGIMGGICGIIMNNAKK